jgi:phage shock protein A
MAGGFSRFFKAIWYTLTGRSHELADRLMQNPEAVRGAFEDIIADKKRNIQRYKTAIAQLITLVKQKEGTVKSLTDDVNRLEQLKAGALAKAKQTAAGLQTQGQPPEQIKAHPDYMKCVAAYNDFSSTLTEKTARIEELEADIGRAQNDIESHKIQLTGLMRDLDKIKSEQSETVADLITAREQEQIADMLSGISTDGTSAELARMRDIRQQAKARAQVSQELAGTDSRAEEEQFLAAARATAASDEFDTLIFGAEQTDKAASQPTPTTTDAARDSKLPV